MPGPAPCAAPCAALPSLRRSGGGGLGQLGRSGSCTTSASAFGSIPASASTCASTSVSASTAASASACASASASISASRTASSPASRGDEGPLPSPSRPSLALATASSLTASSLTTSSKSARCSEEHAELRGRMKARAVSGSHSGVTPDAAEVRAAQPSSTASA